MLYMPGENVFFKDRGRTVFFTFKMQEKRPSNKIVMESVISMPANKQNRRTKDQVYLPIFQ